MNSTTRVSREPDLPRVNIPFHTVPSRETRERERMSLEIGSEFPNFRISIRIDSRCERDSLRELPL